MKQRQQCRALCTVNLMGPRKGAVYQCEEWVAPPAEGPVLCWTHQRAIVNPQRKEPLQLVPEDASP